MITVYDKTDRNTSQTVVRLDTSLIVSLNPTQQIAMHTAHAKILTDSQKRLLQ